MKNSIAIIGAGRVGSTIAYSLIMKNLVADLLIVDVNHERCEGEVRDLADTLAFCETANIRTASLGDAKNADIIIISAGHAQIPGEKRIQLFEKNKPIIHEIVKNLEPINPETIIIVVTNPMDLMTAVAQKASSLPKKQVFGSGTWLDTQRLRRYLGNELGIAPESIDAYVIGEHGDSQCIAWSQAQIGGRPIREMGLTKEKLTIIEKATKNEAYEIIAKKSATYYGIAACVTDICETIIFNQKKILPVSNYCPVFDTCFSMPVIVGAHGIERNIILNLDAKETEELRKSAEKLKNFSS